MAHFEFPPTILEEDPSILEFYSILKDEDQFLKLLVDNGLILTDAKHKVNEGLVKYKFGICSDLKFNVYRPDCPGEIYIGKKSNREAYRCNKCKNSKSMARGSLEFQKTQDSEENPKPVSFFYIFDAFGRPYTNITRQQVLHILYGMVWNFTVADQYRMFKNDFTSVSQNTCNQWRQKIRNACLEEFIAAPKMKDTVQIHIFLLKTATKDIESDEEEEEKSRILQEIKSERSIPTGRSWILAIQQISTRETRYIPIPNKTSYAIVPVILDNVQAESKIYLSDEIEGLDALRTLYWLKNNDGEDHIQALKQSWREVMSNLIKQGCGTNDRFLPAELAYYWWESVHGRKRCSNPLYRLIALIAKRYPQN